VKHIDEPDAWGDCTTAFWRGGLTEPLGAQLPSALQWHNRGMGRTRLSTTVDEHLLSNARAIRSGTTDAALIDEALEALLSRHRAAEVDVAYAAYDNHPIDEPDEWGDLASFRRAAAAS
jgi:antitoxin MazE5